MLQASGEQGELWWAGEPITLTVPLESKDGWEWGPRDPSLRWWLDPPMLTVGDEWVAAERVSERVSCTPARISTKKCLTRLTAQTVLRPLSLALEAETWEMFVTSELAPPTLGGNTQIKHGPTTAVLRGFSPQEALGIRNHSEGLVARLRHGEMAFHGEVITSDTHDGIQLTFKEVPNYEHT